MVVQDGIISLVQLTPTRDSCAKAGSKLLAIRLKLTLVTLTDRGVKQFAERGWRTDN
jgi:hypothetical protein